MADALALTILGLGTFQAGAKMFFWSMGWL